MHKVKVLIAAHHELIRQKLKAILRIEHAVSVVGEATTGSEVMEKTEKLNPDVVILDLLMPDFDPVDAIRRIRVGRPETRVLILSRYDSEAMVREALEAGAAGYVLKFDASNLCVALDSVCRGQCYVSKELSHALGDGLERPRSRCRLTTRETEIAKQLYLGRSSKEIANSLAISARAVETHRANIMRKLNVHSVTEMLNSFYSHKLL